MTEANKRVRLLCEEVGAYEALWAIADYLEKDWPESPVAGIAPEGVKERMEEAAVHCKIAAGLMLS